MIRKNVDLNASFEKLKREHLLSYGDTIRNAYNRLRWAIAEHLEECTEPANTLAADPDDLREVSLTDRLLDNPMQDEEDINDLLDAAYPNDIPENLFTKPNLDQPINNQL